jgi:hypothetical protein
MLIRMVLHHLSTSFGDIWPRRVHEEQVRKNNGC